MEQGAVKLPSPAYPQALNLAWYKAGTDGRDFPVPAKMRLPYNPA
jgi:hypothetical protein